jgi:hypothetical protein
MILCSQLPIPTAALHLQDSKKQYNIFNHCAFLYIPYKAYNETAEKQSSVATTYLHYVGSYSCNKAEGTQYSAFSILLHWSVFTGDYTRHNIKRKLMIFNLGSHHQMTTIANIYYFFLFSSISINFKA